MILCQHLQDALGACAFFHTPAAYLFASAKVGFFKIDVLKCEGCGGQLRPVCAVTDSDSIRRYLKHMDIEYVAPPRGPPRFTQDAFEFDRDFEGGDGSSLPD
jgi:hypothetical protein